jgi:ABC-type transport system involved in Fe-S cluster assembly fused permease/ATPase subunit
VIHNGTIAERGRHAELLQQNGLYRKLTEMQRT